MSNRIKCVLKAFGLPICVVFLMWALPGQAKNEGSSCEGPLLSKTAVKSIPEVSLRPLVEADIEAVVAMAFETETRHFIEAEDQTPEELRQRYIEIVRSSSTPDRRVVLYAVEYEGRLVGSVGIWFWVPTNAVKVLPIYPFARWAQLGRCLDKSVWNKGVGTEAARQMAKIAFEELRVDALMTQTMVHNIRARRSIEKAGFKFAGEDHENAYFSLRHTTLWQRLLSPRRK